MTPRIDRHHRPIGEAGIRSLAVWLLILFIGVIYGWLTSMVIFRGDDMAYSGGLSRYMEFTGNPGWRYPLSHFVNVNGRWGDTFNFLFLDLLPRPILDILCGIFVAAFYWIILRLCFYKYRPGICAQIAVLAAVTFGFTWWNAFLMLVIQINYIWGAVLNLICILLIFSERPLPYWKANALIPLFLIAPAFHEACGLPLLGAMILWGASKSHRFIWQGFRRRLGAAYALGAIFPLCSPGFYDRLFDVGNNYSPDDPVWLVLLKSDYLVGLLILVFGFIWLRYKSLRPAILRSDILFWTIAALTSALFSAVSGVVGRSGWFAQIFALIAIVRLLLLFNFKISRGLAFTAGSILCALVIAHYIGFLYVQRQYYLATEKVISEYRHNPSSPLFRAYLPFNDAPWWVLNRHLGMIEASDGYSLEAERIYGAKADSTLRMLPPELRDVDFATVSLPVITPEGELTANPTSSTEVVITRDSAGRQYVRTPIFLAGRAFYFIRPRDLMPGER